MALSKVNKAIAALIEESKGKVLADFVAFLQAQDELSEVKDDMVTYLNEFTASKVDDAKKKKSPPTAYRLFVQATIERIKKEKIEGKNKMNGKDMMAEAGRLWREKKAQDAAGVKIAEPSVSTEESEVDEVDEVEDDE